MVKKQQRKGKSLTGKSGREAKKGASGIAAAYITRSKALKKLQVTLKDFRRLCILKGIFPRDPKKKREGRDKTYYHTKDIAYLQHEPLLHHFRDLKTFLRKLHRAKVVQDDTRIAGLTANRPVLTLHHLLRERYPTFQLALNDLDDALNLLSLFHHLPTTTLLRAFTPEYAAAISTLLHEYLLVTAHTHSLTKVFVSIKGVYYQASIKTQPITWLMPHQFTQHLPQDVDYRIMFTFVQWYTTLLRFVNFKLYHDASLHYPPAIQRHDWEHAKGLRAMLVEHKKDTQTTAAVTPAAAATGGKGRKRAKVIKVDGQLQKTVDSIVSGLDDEGQEAEEEGDKQGEEGKEADTDGPTFPPEESTPATLDFDKRRSLFSSCTFLLSRETPRLPLELTILSAGGTVMHEMDVASLSSPRPAFTHVVVDRPSVKGEVVKGAHYVQPQWVFDSFNLRVLCPVSLYGVGKMCPPHLSPFVEDEEGGYEPEQRRVQRGWVEGTQQDEREEEVEGGAEKAKEEEMDDETRFQVEMEKERKGVLYTTHAGAHDENKEEEEEGDEGVEEEEGEDEDEGEVEEDEDDEDEDEEDEEADSDDMEEVEEEEEEKEEVKEAPTPLWSKAAARLSEDEEARELAKAMMGKKAARLYQRMQFGIARKQEANEALRKKKEEADRRDKAQQAAQGAKQRRAAESGGATEGQKQTRTKRKRG